MSRDRSQITPCGKTFPQVDAEEERYVAAANDALASLRHEGCRWWTYTVSHMTFELLVGDPTGEDGNVVLCMVGCDHISGPVVWPKQQLRVAVEDNSRHNARLFTLRDDSVGFKAIAAVFNWRRNYDLIKYESLYCPRETPLPR